MRSLSSTLTAAQKGTRLRPAVKLVLVSGETTYTFYNTSGAHRVVGMEHKELAFRTNATIVLDNSDKYFSTLSLRGYAATLSWGLRTSAGLEYSSAAPLDVVVQNLESSPGRLFCVLFCLGEMSMLAEDKADASFLPTTETPKDLIEGTLKGDGGGGLAPFDHLPEYSYEFDTGWDDGLIDSFLPEESVRVYIGTSRLAFIRRLIDFTNDVIRYEHDEKFHILQPVISGDTYDYEYALVGEHVFFSKIQMERLAIPNLVKVWNDDYASDVDHGIDATSYALRPVMLPIKLQKLASDAEANALADAILVKLKMNAKTAEAVAPMNCGQEIWDYVKLTDTRQGGTAATGNVGAITRRYSPGRYNMVIKLGGWTTMKEFASRWEVYGGDVAYPPPSYPLEVDWMWIKTLWFSTLVAVAGGPAIDIIRDEDNMASDDPQALATQQSIKKYVDDEVGGVSVPTTVTAQQAIVTDSSAFNATYINSGGAAKIITIQTTMAAAQNVFLKVWVDDTYSNVDNEDDDYCVCHQYDSGGEGGILSCTFVVPHGYYYRADSDGTLRRWTEWTLDVA